MLYFIVLLLLKSSKTPFRTRLEVNVLLFVEGSSLASPKARIFGHCQSMLLGAGGGPNSLDILEVLHIMFLAFEEVFVTESPSFAGLL